MFTKDTELYYIKQALLAREGFCADVEAFFSDYMHLTYGEAIAKIDAESTDEYAVSWMLNNAVLLGKDNSPDINAWVIEILFKHKVGNMQILLLWRKLKNTPLVPTESKYLIIENIRGTLPTIERKGEWEFSNG